MKTSLSLIMFTVSLAAARETPTKIQNPAIQYGEFRKLVVNLADTNESHRITEDQFLKMAKEPDTVILDARTKVRYEHIHVKGAIHLAFTEFTEESLRKMIPDKNTRVIIYCNNNFENEPVHFAMKSLAVSLNVQTFVNLHAYGYTKVYELGPLLDVHKTNIPFEGLDIGEDGRPKVKPSVTPGSTNGLLRTLPNR